VISLGSNDFNKFQTRDELNYLRHSIDADRVLWILPAHNSKEDIREVVMEIADNFGDDVMDIPNVSADGVHPTGAGYKKIAKSF